MNATRINELRRQAEFWEGRYAEFKARHPKSDVLKHDPKYFERWNRMRITLYELCQEHRARYERAVRQRATKKARGLALVLKAHSLL